MDADFDAVWRRVTGAGRPEEKPGMGEEERLARFIREEAGDAACYAQMAAAGSGAARKLFGELAGEEREHLRRLQTARYLLLGDSCRSRQEPRPKRRCQTGLRGLRERYSAELAGAGAYSAAAAESREPSLRALYERLAGEERKHAERIWELAQRLL